MRRLVSGLCEQGLHAIEGIADLTWINGLAEAAQGILTRTALTIVGFGAGRFQSVTPIRLPARKAHQHISLEVGSWLMVNCSASSLSNRLAPRGGGAWLALSWPLYAFFAIPDALMAYIDVTLMIGDIKSTGFEDVLL